MRLGASKDLTDSTALTPLHTIGRAGKKLKPSQASPTNSVFQGWNNETNQVSNSSESSLSYLDLSRSQPDFISQKEVSDVSKPTSTETLDMLKWLISQGCEYFTDDLSQKERMDYMETTCIHNAIRNDDVALIEYVIEQFGSDILLVRNKEGFTSMHLAVELNKWQLVELLLSTNMIEEDSLKKVIQFS